MGQDVKHNFLTPMDKIRAAYNDKMVKYLEKEIHGQHYNLYVAGNFGDDIILTTYGNASPVVLTKLGVNAENGSDSVTDEDVVVYHDLNSVLMPF